MQKITQLIPRRPQIFYLFLQLAVPSTAVGVNFILKNQIPANCSRTVHLHVLNLHGVMMMLKGSLAPALLMAIGCGHLCERVRVFICPCSWENFPSSSLPLQISAKEWAATAGYQPWLVFCFFSLESYSFLQAFCKVFSVCQVGRTICGSFCFPCSLCSCL